jgi:hypothetical protein
MPLASFIMDAVDSAMPSITPRARGPPPGRDMSRTGSRGKIISLDMSVKRLRSPILNTRFGMADFFNFYPA